MNGIVIPHRLLRERPPWPSHRVPPAVRLRFWLAFVTQLFGEYAPNDELPEHDAYATAFVAWDPNDPPPKSGAPPAAKSGGGISQARPAGRSRHAKSPATGKWATEQQQETYAIWCARASAWTPPTAERWAQLAAFNRENARNDPETETDGEAP